MRRKYLHSGRYDTGTNVTVLETKKTRVLDNLFLTEQKELNGAGENTDRIQTNKQSKQNLSATGQPQRVIIRRRRCEDAEGVQLV